MSMFNTYTKDANTPIAEEKNIVQGAIDVLAAPFAWDENVLVTQKARAITAISHLAIGFLAGEAFGHRRAADGKRALVPFLRAA